MGALRFGHSRFTFFLPLPLTAVCVVVSLCVHLFLSLLAISDLEQERSVSDGRSVVRASHDVFALRSEGPCSVNCCATFTFYTVLFLAPPSTDVRYVASDKLALSS